MTRLRLLALLAALVGLAGTLTACGSDGATADEVLAATFDGDEPIRSGRLDLTVRADLRGLPNLPGPVTVRLSGPFASAGAAELPRFDLTLGVTGPGQSVQVGAVSTGDAGFLRFGSDAYAIGDDLLRQLREGYARQARCGAGRRGGVTLAALGVDPRRWLRDAQDAGTEDVGGAEARHLRARVDVPRMLEDVDRVLTRGRGATAPDPCARDAGRDAPARPAAPTGLGAAQRRELARAVRDARVDLWTGVDDRILRRLTVDLRIAVPADRRGAAGGLEGGRLAFDLALGGVNEEQEIAAPEGAEPLGALSERFGGALPIPGLGGAGATGAGGGAGGDDYLTCLGRAGDDVGRQQRCAELARG